MESDLQDHGIALDLDAALYDQLASETRSGRDNLVTFSWQASISWRLLDSDRWGSGSINWNLLGSQGLNYAIDNQTLSSNVGSISGLNANVYPNAGAVDELFWEHVFAGKRWTLLIGRIDQAAYFDTNRAANDAFRQFFAFGLENNLSIPWSTYGGFGGLLRFDPDPDLYLMISVGTSGNANPRVSRGAIGGRTWDQFFEIGITRRLPRLGLGHYRLTPWHNSLADDDGFGIAFNLDQELGREWLVGFFRCGVGDPGVTPVERFLSGGVSIAHPFGRGRDQLALGVAWSDPSPDNGERSETLIESYYRLYLSHSLALTPNAQWVIHPANNTAVDSVLVLGVRLQLQL